MKLASDDRGQFTTPKTMLVAILIISAGVALFVPPGEFQDTDGIVSSPGPDEWLPGAAILFPVLGVVGVISFVVGYVISLPQSFTPQNTEEEIR